MAELLTWPKTQREIARQQRASRKVVRQANWYGEPLPEGHVDMTLYNRALELAFERAMFPPSGEHLIMCRCVITDESHYLKGHKADIFIIDDPYREE